MKEQYELQYVFLDFDGEVTVFNGDILALECVTVQDSQLSSERISTIAAALNAKYASQNITFVTEKPVSGDFSTIFIGKSEELSAYGDFTGLSETVDSNNTRKNDNAFVLLDSSASDSEIISVAAHETDHLTGALDHGGEGLERYAATHYHRQTYTGVVDFSYEFGYPDHGYDDCVVDEGGDPTIVYRYYTKLRDAEIVDGGDVYVWGVGDSCAGEAYNVTVRPGGYLHVIDGGTARYITLNGGRMAVESGRVNPSYPIFVDNVTINNGGKMDLYGGTTTNIVVNLGGRLDLMNAQAQGVTLNPGGFLCWHPGDGQLTDITFAGGAIYYLQDKTPLNIETASFSNNSRAAVRVGNGYYTPEVTIGNFTTFCNNSGGVLCEGGNVKVGAYAVFSSNTASSGGAICISRWGSVDVGTQPQFNNNSAVRGGAIYNPDSCSVGNSAIFQQNSASDAGGAIYNIDSMGAGALTSFFNNSATSSGGAIYNFGSMTLGEGIVFSGNNASYGGAIYNHGSMTLGATQFATVSDTVYNIDYLYFAGDVSFAGNVLTGENNLDYFFVNGNVDMNICERNAAHGVLLKNSVKIENETGYSVSVKEEQGYGEYLLMDDAEYFEFDSITLNYEGSAVGNISADGTAFTYNNKSYFITVENDIMILNIGSGDTDDDDTGGGGGAGNITEPGREVQVWSQGILVRQGRVLTGEHIKGSLNNSMYVYPQGTAYQTVVSSGGVMEVVAKAYNLDGYYYGGSGSASDVTVLSRGTIKIGGKVEKLVVSSGGAASMLYSWEFNNTQGEWGEENLPDDYREPDIFEFRGTLINGEIKSGATLTAQGDTEFRGTNIFGGTVNLGGSVYAAGTVVFDIKERTTADSYIINNVLYINPDEFVVSVTASQESGRYILADSAYNHDGLCFNRTVSVECGDWKSQGIGVGESVTGNYATYTLNVIGTQLVFYVENKNIVDPEHCEKNLVEIFKNNLLVSQAAVVTGKNLVSWNENLMHVHQGGTAIETTVSVGGVMNISSGGLGSNTTISGGKVYVYSSGTARVTEVSGGALLVSENGKSFDTIVKDAGTLEVFKGGIASNNIISGYAGIYGGTAYYNDIRNEMYLQEGGSAMYNSVFGYMEVADNASGSMTYVKNGGTVDVFDGKLGMTYVSQGGELCAYNKALLSNTVVSNGGTLTLANGAKHTGTLTINTGGVVTAAAGSIIDFDITGRSESSDYIVSNWALISGAPSCTITVAAAQACGTYKLASNAANFNATVSVNTPAAYYGTVSLNKSLTVNGKTYSITRDSNTAALTLTIAQHVADTQAPTINSISLTQGANNYVFTLNWDAVDNISPKENLTVTLAYASTAAQLNNALTYTNSFTLQASDAGKTYYYRALIKDEAGNVASHISTFTVADRTAPTFDSNPTATADAYRNTVISWTPAKDNVAVDHYILKVNGKVVADNLSVNTLSYTLADLDQGVYSYSIAAVDAAGNQSRDYAGASFSMAERVDLTIESIKFYVNGTEVSSIGSNQKVDVVVKVRNSGNFITPAFKISLACGGNRLLSADTTIAQNGTASVTFTGIELPQAGTHTFTATADCNNSVKEAQESNNTLQSSLVVNEVDSNAPVFDVFSCTQGAGKNNYSFTINAVGRDNESASLKYEYFHAASESMLQALIKTGNSNSQTFLKSKDNAGQLVWYACRITDEEGNSTVRIGSVMIEDRTPPVLNTVPEARENAETLVITWAAGSDNVGISHYIVTINNTEYQINGTETTFVLSTIPNGSITYSVTAVDAAGYTSKECFGTPITLRTDTIPPVIDTETYKLTQGNGNYTFSWTLSVSDNQNANENLTVRYYYSFDASTIFSGNGLTRDNFTLSANDYHDYIYHGVIVTDAAGNSTRFQGHLKMTDYTPPTLTGNVTITEKGNQVTLSWNNASDNDKVLRYLVTVNGKTTPVYGLTSLTVEADPSGKYEYSVVAEDYSGNASAALSGSFGANRNQADLLFEKVYFEQEGKIVDFVDLNKPFSCTVIIKNQGSADAAECTGKVFWGERSEEFSISSVSANGTAVWKKEFAPGDFTTGKHNIKLHLDTRNSIAESDEENNSRELLLVVEDETRCDLTVEKVGFDPSVLGGIQIFVQPVVTYFNPNSDNKVYFRVKNTGKGTAGSTTAQLKAIDRSGKVILLGEVPISALAPNEAAGYSFTIPAGTLYQSGKIYVTVNPDSLLSENNLNNNSNYLSYNVFMEGFNDLEVTDAVLEQKSVRSGTTVTLTFSVANTGPANVANLDVAVQCNGQTIGVTTVDSLAAGKQITGTIQIDTSLLAPGSHQLTVVADPENKTYDQDLSNNTFSVKELILEVIGAADTAPVFNALQIIQGSSNYTLTASVSVTDDQPESLVYEYCWADSPANLKNRAYTTANTITLTPADAGKNFYLLVRVTDSAGQQAEQTASITVADKTAPVINAKAITVNSSATSIELSWGGAVTDNVGVVKYNLYVDGVLYRENLTATSCSVSGLNSGSHTWKLEAFDDAGLSSSTGNMTVRFDDTTPPELASGVKVTQIEGTYSFRVTASATDNVTAPENIVFKVRCQFNDATEDKSIPLLTLDANNCFTLPADCAGKALYTWVYAFDEAGNQSKHQLIAQQIDDFDPPTVPESLVAEIDHQTAVLFWGESVDNAKVWYYRVRISTDPAELDTMPLTSHKIADDTNFVFKGAPGVYYWQVAASDNWNLSEWSEVHSFRLLAADPREDNNTVEKSSDLGILNGTALLAGSNLGSAGDVDWYKFTLTTLGKAGDYISVELVDTLAGGVTIELYDAAGTKLLKTVSADTKAQLSLENVSRGSYTLKVSSPVYTTADYIFGYQKDNGVAPDKYEENDSFREAKIINLAEQPESSLQGTIDQHQGRDVDYFRIDLDHTGRADEYLQLSFNNSSGNLDLYLYDSNENEVNHSATSNGVEGISLMGLASGTYYIKVTGASEEIQNQYTLSWKVTSFTVEHDKFEGSEPLQLTNGDTKALTISADQNNCDKKDTFTFTVTTGNSAGNKIIFGGELAPNLTYTVNDSSGKTVLSGNLRNGTVKLHKLEAGDYTLTVDTIGDTYGEYTVKAELETGTAGKKQAILLYIGADNNGHERYLYEIAQLQQRILNEGVEVYVFIDRSADSAYQGNWNFGFEEWSSAKFCKLQYIPGQDDPAAQAWLDWGEVDSSSVSTLQKFIDTSMSMAQADQYTLIIKNHGYISGKISVDDTSLGSTMSVASIAEVLKQYSNIPVVTFDACYLGSEHVIATMQGACDYLIASEATSYSLGVNLRLADAISAISGDSTAEEVARSFIDTANGGTEAIKVEFPYSHEGKIYYWASSTDHTLGLYNVSDTALFDALNKFAGNREKFTSSDWLELARAYGATFSYGSCYSNVDMDYSDLRLIMERVLSSDTASAFLKDSVSELLAGLNSVVLSTVIVPETYGGSFSVYNPITSDESSLAIYCRYHLDAGLAEWGSFVKKLADYRYNTASQTIKQTTVLQLQTTALDLGFFYGANLTFNALELETENCFTFRAPAAFADGDAIVCSIDGGETVSLALYDQEMNLLAVSENSALQLKGMGDADGFYILKVTTSAGAPGTLSFLSETVTGTDRFDYAETHSTAPDANGNGTIAKATKVAAGFYSGLLTYSSDSDWYSITASADNRSFIRVAGSGLNVAAYSGDGTLLKTAEYLNGEYYLTMPDSCFLRIEGTADIAQGEVNSYTMQISTITAASETLGIASGLSWNAAGNQDSFTVVLSNADSSETLNVTAANNALDIYGLNSGTYQWQALSGENVLANSVITNENSVSLSQIFRSDFDGNTDLFFAPVQSVWSGAYVAEHQGDGSWAGLREKISLAGKNRFGSIFEGSGDANILVLTDDANGDALFVDDIFTEFPDTATAQARMKQINVIRAGAGDDIVDMTSESISYFGNNITIYGGAGNDTLWANSNSSKLSGGSGNDRLIGGSGDDILSGGSGNDRMHGGGGDDIFIFDGGFGKDIVEQLADGQVTLWFTDGEERYWDGDTLTYSDGTNSVEVKNVSLENITLKFGVDDLPAACCFDDDAEKIFENKNKGMLA